MLENPEWHSSEITAVKGLLATMGIEAHSDAYTIDLLGLSVQRRPRDPLVRRILMIQSKVITDIMTSQTPRFRKSLSHYPCRPSLD